MNDYSLFHKKSPLHSVYLVVYVDDLLVTGDYLAGIVALKEFLHSTFSIKDLGPLNYFLGIEFLSTPQGILMTQRKFIQELLDDFLPDSKRVTSCPLDPCVKLSPTIGTPLLDPTPYRKLVGKLNFLTNSRPDLSFTVQHLCQFMQAPTDSHWQAAIHVLQYLLGTTDLGLLLNNSIDFQLQASCDSDWASCPTTRRSVSGFYITLGASPISWKSKKQVTISLSSAEAEYRSMRRVTAELSWLSRLLHELEVPHIQPIPLRCDSQSAIYIAKNPVFHERTKHIEIDCHYVRSQLLAGLISLHHVPTHNQIADVFTKSLPGSKHSSILPKLGLIPQSPPT